MADLGDLTRVFARIGVLSFGGPAAQIALMLREIVEKRAWVSEKDYLSALSFCMLLPGPEAMQLATWVGWRRAGVLGGLIAGGLFVLPGAVLVLALAMGYAAYGDLPLVKAVFVGVQAAVLAVVIEALLRLSRRALKGRATIGFAFAAFAALFLFALPFPVVILTAGILGAALLRAPVAAKIPVQGSKTALRQSLRAGAVWGALWLGPLAAILAFAPPILGQIALFFSKLALLTFGGAYAVLSWMTAEVVTAKGWLTAPQMLDALALAETTPGPLILVTQFVGYLAAFGQGGVLLGIAGALVTLWMTFIPCFLWIFAGAPWMERLQNAPRLSAALAGIMAAVVGTIAHLSLWFALHVLFARQILVQEGPLHLLLPDLASLNLLPFALSALACLLLLRLHWGLAAVLAICAALAGAVSLFTGGI